ncbi:MULTISPECIES: hypothetical protein [unclassified Amycolatopsis]|uniref:hypothetical protein n=1 Tax=unclassified Amycolatopsis TaxID=2618356 RepID=UPI002E2362BD|nr:MULTISPECIES: hypothetical protein [unclassified Amycolatopsis]
MRVSRIVVVLGCAAVVGSFWLVPPVAAGDTETDRQSTTLAAAIGYPRQADAAGFARAALATPLGRSASFGILEVTDLPHDGPRDPMARLVWRIHHEPPPTDWNLGPDAFDACYRVEFDYYGTSSGPSRITCPANAAAITPPPVPKRGIPAGFVPALEAVLGHLPATAGVAEVRAALTAGMPTPPVDPETHLAGIPPEVLVQVRGTDVGVALFARTGVETTDCTMGRRVEGVVRVWSLSARDQRMELPCGAEAALAAP